MIKNKVYGRNIGPKFVFRVSICHSVCVDLIYKKKLRKNHDTKHPRLQIEDQSKSIESLTREALIFGVGLDFNQLRELIQELLTLLKESNHARYCPPSWENCYPETTFVRRFAVRNKISLRRTMALSGARAHFSMYDLDQWFANIREIC